MLLQQSHLLLKINISSKGYDRLKIMD